MASSASQPNLWLRLAALPNFVVKYGSISSTTRGSTGVVEWLSMKMGSFRAIGIPSCPSLGAKAQDEIGHVALLVVQVAALAGAQEAPRIAHVTRVEILHAGRELVLEGLEA